MPVVAPLSQIVPVAWVPPPPDSVDAVLVTSANAVRAGDPALAPFLHLPVYAVGPKSAAAACSAGFARVERVGDDGVQALLAVIAAIPNGPRRLLHLTTDERTPAAIPLNLAITIRETYGAGLLPLDDRLADPLCHGHFHCALIYSKRAAEHFVRELDRLRVPLVDVPIAALSSQVRTAAERAGARWLLPAPYKLTEDWLFYSAGLLPHEPPE